MVMLTASLSSCNSGGDLFLVSGYSAGGAADVLLCRLHGNGTIEKLSEIALGDNPSYFTVGQEGLIYFVNEVDTFGQRAGGGITTVRYDRKSQTLEKVSSINQHGGGPCHITLTHDGRHLITTNYGSGSVSVVRLGSDGIPQKVTDLLLYGGESHPHMSLYNQRLKSYYVTDLGLGRLYQFRLDTLFGLLMNSGMPYFSLEQGSGPRHMVTDNSSANLYIVNELNSTLSVYNILSDTIQVKQTVTALPEGFSGKSYCGDIQLFSGGRKIHASNRGDNSIVTFRIGNDGTLSDPSFADCGGDWPRSFAITRSGKYFLVANQRSDMISVVPVSAGRGDNVVSSLPLKTPSCIRLLR